MKLFHPKNSLCKLDFVAPAPSYDKIKTGRSACALVLCVRPSISQICSLSSFEATTKLHAAFERMQIECSKTYETTKRCMNGEPWYTHVYWGLFGATLLPLDSLCIDRENRRVIDVLFRACFAEIGPRRKLRWYERLADIKFNKGTRDEIDFVFFFFRKIPPTTEWQEMVDDVCEALYALTVRELCYVLYLLHSDCPFDKLSCDEYWAVSYNYDSSRALTEYNEDKDDLSQATEDESCCS